MHLHSTLIGSWTSVHHLNSFPSLTTLRLKEVPIVQNDEDSHSCLIARITKLKRLNGSYISTRNRLDAELYYLTQCLKEKDHQDFQNLHPRYEELVSIHGEPTLAPIALTSSILKDKVMLITLKYGGKSMERKLMGNMKLKAVRNLLYKLFKINPLASAQIYLNSSDSRMQLEDDFKEMSWYDIEQGHELELVLV